MAKQQEQIHSLETLFEPYTVQQLTIHNRIVMSPMARAFSPEGVLVRIWQRITAAVLRMGWG